MSSGEQSVAESEGYYYSADHALIIEAGHGDILPEGEEWEYLGSSKDMTPADAVAEVERRYPDVSVELTFKKV